MEGACVTLKFNQAILLRALPQSPLAPAPSRREPLEWVAFIHRDHVKLIVVVYIEKTKSAKAYLQAFALFLINISHTR